jgi:hypothetical protein
MKPVCTRCLDQNPRFSFPWRRKCIECGRNLTIRWYEYLSGFAKLCRTCKVLHRSGSDMELFDDWGAVDEPAGSGMEHPSRAWGTQARISEMPQKSQQRIANALAVFSLRPYFTRLWVCVLLPQQSDPLVS